MSTAYLFQNEIPPTSILDPDSRDPMGINKHLQLNFFNVIAEPDTSAYNFEVLHRLLHQVYHYSKVFIYRFLTILIGLPLMLCWGLLFGSYTFSMIWVAVPIRRLCQSLIAESGLYVQTISDALIGPIHRSMGQIFSGIRVSLSKVDINATKQIQV
ncbi:unnamed protein product [Rotaria sp. Silwood1]|nr:unnamed protein product [Rotaria sp. Silwood1]CAF0885633.1 unnamed protein product [Rotaria sp. Silwood1]CAF0899548.1 unnamed protein product [Rotaria sp. Silwood1]CAF3349262.1 unnamed protein product [Rotaria sp. Silwood1]CAF3373571.1 unnamed protein product [Rotaria sp. Silwood1]